MKFVGIKEGDPVLVMTVTLYYYGAVAGHTDDFIALNGCSGSAGAKRPGRYVCWVGRS